MTGKPQDLKGKTFLVTGGAGFVGARAVHLLCDRGAQVRVLTRAHKPWRLDSVIDQVECHVGDLSDESLVLKAVTGVDAVLHLAALGLKWGPSTSLRELVDANLMGTYHVIRAAGWAKVPQVVLAGSVFEFGGMGTIDERADLSVEMAPRPLNYYGVTKAAATMLAPLVGDEVGVNTVTLRIFSPYGPGEPRFRLIPSLIDAAHKDEEIKVTLGEQVRDYCYVDDVASAFIEAAQIRYDGHQLFHLGTGIATSVREVTELVLAGMDATSLAKFGELEYRQGEVFRLVADASALDPRLARCLATPLAEGIKKTIEWFEQNRGEPNDN